MARQMRGSRAVGVIRLSRHSLREDDPSTSPERQRQHIRSAAEARGITIIDWAEDLNISAAKVAPWERPELGKRIDLSSKPDFDTLIFWKLDRLVRSVGDFARLIEWAVAYDVNLISTDGSVDLSTPMGKAMAQIVAVFAELEAAIIKERVNDSRPVVLADGRWHGGRHPWGYKPVKADGGGWRLIEDKEASPVLRELIDRVIGGEPMYAVQQDFSARGIRTPKGGKDGWVSVSVGKILRSRNLLGEFDFIEKVDGIDVTRTVQRAEPLVDHDTFAQLQRALGNETRRRTGASILLDVAFCGVCGEKLYQRNTNKSGNTYRYYGCSGQWGKIKNGCRRKSVRADALEEATTDALLSTIGNFDYFRTETIGGIDHSAEIDDTERKIADLVVMMAGQPDGVKRLLEAELDRLNTRLEALSVAPVTEATTAYVPTGEKYAEVWARSGGDERRALLVNSGIRIEALEPAGDEGFVSYWRFERPTKVVEESSAVQISITHGIPILMWIPKDIIQRATQNDRRKLTFVERPLITSHG